MTALKAFKYYFLFKAVIKLSFNHSEAQKLVLKKELHTKSNNYKCTKIVLKISPTQADGRICTAHTTIDSVRRYRLDHFQNDLMNDGNTDGQSKNFAHIKTRCFPRVPQEGVYP